MRWKKVFCNLAIKEYNNFNVDTELFFYKCPINNIKNFNYENLMYSEIKSLKKKLKETDNETLDKLRLLTKRLKIKYNPEHVSSEEVYSSSSLSASLSGLAILVAILSITNITKDFIVFLIMIGILIIAVLSLYNSFVIPKKVRAYRNAYIFYTTYENIILGEVERRKQKWWKKL